MIQWIASRIENSVKFLHKFDNTNNDSSNNDNHHVDGDIDDDNNNNVEENRVPLVLIHSSSNAAAIISSAYHYYVFILAPSIEFVYSRTTTTTTMGTEPPSSLIVDIIENVAKYFYLDNNDKNQKNRVRFVAVPYNEADEATKHLFHFFDVEVTHTPTIRMLSTKKKNNDDAVAPQSIDEHSIHRYDQPVEGYTVEGIKSFVQSHIIHDSTAMMTATTPQPPDHRPDDNHGDEL